MGIVIDKGAWSDVRCQSGWIKWLFSSEEPHHRNIKSITKFESLSLSEYLVGTWLIEHERFKLKESAMIIRSLLREEWWGKEGFHKLSQMLKSLVITKRLQMFTSVSLRYFQQYARSQNIYSLSRNICLCWKMKLIKYPYHQ